MHQSKAITITMWLICVCAWGFGVLNIARPTTTIAISELSEVATEYSFQYPEQWDARIPFRWSFANAQVTLAPLRSDHVVVDVYAIGHQPQQALTFTLSGGEPQHIATTDQQFRHYRLLFIQSVPWLPSTHMPQLSIHTETATLGERTLGVAIAHITTEPIARQDARWWWDLVWVAVTLWMCGVWTRSSWYAYRWIGLLGVTTLLLGLEWLVVADGYMRGVQIISVLIFQDYQRYPLRLRNGWQRLHQWLVPTAEEHAPISRIITQWYTVCALANVVTIVIVWLRAGASDESWDRLFYVATFAVAVAYMSTQLSGWQWQPSMVVRTLWQGGLALSWGILLWQGFQPEALRPGVIPRFAGFDHWFLLITVVIVAAWTWGSTRVTRHPWARWLLRFVATWVVVVAISTLWQGNDQYHNLFIMNEVLAPVSQRTAGHDFIPHYSVVFNIIPQLLLPWRAALGAAVFVDMVFFSLKISGIALVALVIRTVAHLFPRPDYPKAILFIVPIMGMSAYPWWHMVATSTPIMDFLAYVPVRLFSIMIPIVVALWLLERHAFAMSRSSVIGIGLVAGLGMFNNSDFGVFAAAALGITLVVSPTQTSWIRRIGTGATYTGGIIAGYLVIALCYWALQKPLTLEYLFWFQRQYGAGFGALMIRSPGPGVFFIVVAVSLWVVVCVALLSTASLRSWLSADGMRMRIATVTVYFASCAAFGLIYYLNRSSAAGQLSMSFIPFWLAIIGLWRLAAMAPHPRRSASTALHVLVAVPLALSVSFVRMPQWPPAFNTFSHAIHLEQQASMPSDAPKGEDARSVWPFAAAQQSATSLRDRGFNVAYFGPWAHIFAVYTDIPSSLLFNRPVDGNVSATSKGHLCATIAANHYTALVVPDVTASTTHLCGDFVLITTQQLPLRVAIAQSWIDAQPKAWATLRTQLDVCATTPRRFMPCQP